MINLSEYSLLIEESQEIKQFYESQKVVPTREDIIELIKIWFLTIGSGSTTMCESLADDMIEKLKIEILSEDKINEANIAGVAAAGAVGLGIFKVLQGMSKLVAGLLKAKKVKTLTKKSYDPILNAVKDSTQKINALRKNPKAEQKISDVRDAAEEKERIARDKSDVIKERIDKVVGNNKMLKNVRSREDIKWRIAIQEEKLKGATEKEKIEIQKALGSLKKDEVEKTTKVKSDLKETKDKIEQTKSKINNVGEDDPKKKQEEIDKLEDKISEADVNRKELVNRQRELEIKRKKQGLSDSEDEEFTNLVSNIQSLDSSVSSYKWAIKQLKSSSGKKEA